MMKTISIFLALVNSLMAGLILAFSLSGSEIRQAATWWLLTKVFAALGVIAVSVLTWLASMRAIRSSLMSLSSLFLVALGAATTVWTFHLALVTGDLEYYMILFGGSLVLQGMASLFGFVSESRNMIAS
jgi:hypothetical protein